MYIPRTQQLPVQRFGGCDGLFSAGPAILAQGANPARAKASGSLIGANSATETRQSLQCGSLMPWKRSRVGPRATARQGSVRVRFPFLREPNDSRLCIWSL